MMEVPGPLVETGRIAAPGTMPGSRKWLFDSGAQAKLRIFGRGLVFSYAKDLGSGNNAFDVALLAPGIGAPNPAK